MMMMNEVIMKNKYLNKLELNKILEHLASFAITDLGKQKCLDLLPCNKKEKVTKWMQETTEASILLARKSTPPLVPINDITIPIKILKNNGTLSASYLLSLASLLKVSRELKEYSQSDIDTSFSTVVIPYFNELYSNPKIENTIFSSIIDENTIDDRASTELYNIRKKERKTEQDIRNALSSFLNSKYIQEPIITIRNNRYVIPVKQEYRSEIKGLLHDTSSSGSTLFIEPISVFELNNSLNNLKAEENLEIEAILAKLSSLFTDILEELEHNFFAISKIDFAFAKAKYANILKATEPIISNTKQIVLKNARHPLIETDKVVPISISLGNSFSTLVVTGPNTGGKTVTLKTVGLLTAMAMCGLHIPTDENSIIYIFDFIFADIGDDQSISESLSTFSAHMTNIIEIIKKSSSESLILLDELGSGTDPVEGSSLAVSILEYLSNKDILTIATTHYPEVKNYALMNPKFENASSEFDLATLSPTYRLLIGVPGKSMAFAISQKLGLNADILKSAKERIGQEKISTEELLKNIYDNNLSIQKAKEKTEAYLKKIETLKKELEEKETSLQEKEQAIIADAKLKARNILLETKEETDEMIRKLQHVSSTSKASKIREELNTKIKNIKPDNQTKQIETSLTADNIKEGMSVYVTSLKQEGIVLSKPNKANMVSIQIGSLKTNIPIGSLSPSHNQTTKQATPSLKTSTNLNKKNVSSEINVIGLNVDEATFLVDKFLDDAALCRLPSVRIVHGKGTGTLRKGIHQFLKTNKHVASFRLGTFGEGEMGVTIVEIK